MAGWDCIGRNEDAATLRTCACGLTLRVVNGCAPHHKRAMALSYSDLRNRQAVFHMVCTLAVLQTTIVTLLIFASRPRTWRYHGSRRVSASRFHVSHAFDLRPIFACNRTIKWTQTHFLRKPKSDPWPATQTFINQAKKAARMIGWANNKGRVEVRRNAESTVCIA